MYASVNQAIKKQHGVNEHTDTVEVKVGSDWMAATSRAAAF